MTADDRRADRRRRLLAAALEIVGTHGYRRATIEAVCADAGVTARNFYDEFPTREDMLLALYDDVVEEHLAALGAAEDAAASDTLDARVRAGVEAAVGAWIADPRKARVSFVEVIGVSERVEAHRFAILRRYGARVTEGADRLAADGLIEPRDRTLAGLAVVGAMTQLLADWLHEPGDTAVEAIVDELARVTTAILLA